jgi:hypothetical protein
MQGGECMRYLIFILIISPLSANAKVKTEGGRFQLIQLNEMRRDQFMIDTQTGELWQRLCLSPGTQSGDCDAYVWRKEIIEGVTLSSAKFEQAMKKLGQ